MQPLGRVRKKRELDVPGGDAADMPWRGEEVIDPVASDSKAWLMALAILVPLKLESRFLARQRAGCIT